MTNYNCQCYPNDVCGRCGNRSFTGLRNKMRTHPAVRRIAKVLWDMTDVIDKPIYPLYRTCKNVGMQAKYACQRAKRGYSDLDLWNLGGSEVKRLSIMLDALAEEAHGYPAGYGDRSRWLKHRDMSDEEFEQWLDTAAPWQLHEPAAKKSKAGYYRLPTVRERGYEFCAWCEDLRYAAKVLRLWQRWCTAGGEAMGMDWRSVFGAESAHDHYVRVKEQFEITWAWIGHNIGDLWD